MICAGLVVALRPGEGGGARLAATRAVPPSSVTSATTPTTSGRSPTTTADTTTETPRSTWFAVVLSVRKDGADRDALLQELAHIGDGRIVDTDDVRTGDGRAPDYLPAPGLLVAAVGPFNSREQVEAWCGGYGGAQGCQARRLVSH